MAKISFNKDYITTFNELDKWLYQYRNKRLILFRGQDCDEPLLPRIARFKGIKNFSQKEKYILEEFKSLTLLYRKYEPKTEWDFLALGQHHGLATRLLDWTANPLIALWFALKGKDSQKNGGFIWAFNVPQQDIIRSSEKSSPFDIGRTKIFRPNHISPRITAQQGWFTAHKLTKSGKFIDLQENERYKNRLEKKIIPASLLGKFEDKLNLYGINLSTVFPEMLFISEYIINKYLN